MRSRTVLHLIDTGGPGGAETIFLNLVTRLDPERWRSIAVVPERDWLFDAVRRAGMEPILVPTDGSFDVKYLLRLATLARSRRVDLIQTHLLTTGVYGSVVGRMLRLPVVCTFHGEVDLETADRRAGAKLRIIAHPRNRVVFVSEPLRRAFLDRHGMRAHTLVVPNGVEFSAVEQEPKARVGQALGIDADELVIGAVGNIRHAKDYPLLLKAIALLRPRVQGVRLVVVGHAMGTLYDRLLRLRSELGLDDVVLFTGFREDVTELMGGFDIYVLSSSAEGFSLSTVQAMACALPVVATRCGGPEAIIEHGVSGVLVENGSAEALAAALEALIMDPERRAALGRAGREHARRRFTMDAMIRGYEEVYEEALRRGRADALDRAASMQPVRP